MNIRFQADVGDVGDGAGIFNVAGDVELDARRCHRDADVALHCRDLFAGRWVYLDSRTSQFSAWWVSPLLALILMFGPLGLLTYLIARTLVSRALHPATAAA